MGTSHSGIYKTQAIPGSNRRQERRKYMLRCFQHLQSPARHVPHDYHELLQLLGLSEPWQRGASPPGVEGLVMFLIWFHHKLRLVFAEKRGLSWWPVTQQGGSLFFRSVWCTYVLLSSVSIPKMSPLGEEMRVGPRSHLSPCVFGKCLITESNS